MIGLFLALGDPARAELLAVGVALLAMAALLNLMDGMLSSRWGSSAACRTPVPMIVAALSCRSASPWASPWGSAFVVWLGLVVGLAPRR